MKNKFNRCCCEESVLQEYTYVTTAGYVPSRSWDYPLVPQIIYPSNVISGKANRLSYLPMTTRRTWVDGIIHFGDVAGFRSLVGKIILQAFIHFDTVQWTSSAPRPPGNEPFIKIRIRGVLPTYSVAEILPDIWYVPNLGNQPVFEALGKTGSFVDFSKGVPGGVTIVEYNYRTPSIADIIQEIMDNPSWTPEKGFAFWLSDGGSNGEDGEAYIIEEILPTYFTASWWRNFDGGISNTSLAVSDPGNEDLYVNHRLLMSAL